MTTECFAAWLPLAEKAMPKANHNCSNKRLGRALRDNPRLGLLLTLVFAFCAGAATNHRVVLLHSFGRDFSPFDVFSRTFRTELALQMSGTVVFYDFDLETARFESGGSEDPAVGYLTSLFGSQRVDLIVPIGGPAARFAQKQRERLFPSTPMLIAAADQRHLQSALLTTNDSVVSVANDNRQMIASILQLLPATTNIAVVIGNSPLEKFWLEEWRREFQPFSTNVNFEWLTDLSYAEMQKRVSVLAPRSAIFYGMLFIDAESVPYPGQRTLIGLHAAANAPMFGLHESELGFGIVGGRLMGIEDLGRSTATAAARILRGERPSNIRPPPQVAGNPIYDWRELRRWGISERNLPDGSVIRFRQPTFWQLYTWDITLVIVGICALLGILHYAHVALLHIAHRAQAVFTQQLIVSQESERKRIASELHDGLGQDLLIIKNWLGLLATSARHPPEVAGQFEKLSTTALHAIAEVRTISQALRPVALEQVGLTKALDWMIEQMGAATVARFSTQIDNVDGLLAPDVEINLYRIIQEALNNVIKHAEASQVTVELKRQPGEISLAIVDNGRGFIPQHARNGRTSLGLVGMAERTKLLAGKLEIQSDLGTGTRLTLSIPVPFPVVTNQT